MGNKLSVKQESEKITEQLQTMTTKFLSTDFLGYPISKFALMPPGTNVKLVAEAMVQIASENKEINGIDDTSFSGGPSDCVGLPYMELLIPDSTTGNYYVYSATNPDGYLFSTDANNLVTNNPEILTNPYRFYMWNTTIFNLAVQPTEQFPSEKEFPYTNGDKTMVQKMFLKATTVPNQNGAYTTSTIIRNTIYVYYPSSILYALVDNKAGDIYVMQSGNNQNTGTTPLTPENMIYTQQLIASTLPAGMVFLAVQLLDDQTVCIVSSPKKPAVLMQDSLGNSYQLADKYYAKSLYDSFTPVVKQSS